MKITVIALFVVGALTLIGGGLFGGNLLGTIPSAEGKAARPWIEVVEPAIFLKTTEGAERRLETGDELDEGSTVRTDTEGVANIYFPDGSVARIDSATLFTLEEGSFDDKSETLVVRIRLSAGRVWSKIFELATPESSWEVETANAVATVRGTAFGVEFRDGQSSVLGSENTVTVAAIDPTTKEVIPDTEVAITPDLFIAIDEKIIEDIKEEVIILTEEVKAAPVEIKEQEWVLRAEAEDIRFEERLEVIKERAEEEARKERERARSDDEPLADEEPVTIDREVIRKAFREEIQEQFEPFIEERREIQKERKAEEERIRKDEEEREQKEREIKEEERKAEQAELMHDGEDDRKIEDKEKASLLDTLKDRFFGGDEESKEHEADNGIETAEQFFSIEEREDDERNALFEERIHAFLEKDTGPGGCRTFDECDAFCSKEANGDVCMRFAVENGLMTKEEAEAMMRMEEAFDQFDGSPDSFESFKQETDAFLKDIDRASFEESDRFEHEGEKDIFPKGITIETKVDFSRISEKDAVELRAVLVLSDGSRHDVTHEAKWSVVGPVGFMERPGLFIAVLDREVSELGTSSGSIVALWHDPRTGQEFLTKTPIFEVHGFVPEVIDKRG